jgi:hypothetical protein
METPATELTRMAYRLLSMNNLTRTNIVKKAEIRMSDGSTLLYNIDLTIQTEQEHSIAYQQMKDLHQGSAIEPIELVLVHLLCDPICKEESEDDEDEDSIV